MTDDLGPCYLSLQDHPYQSLTQQEEYGYLEWLLESYAITSYLVKTNAGAVY